MSQEKQPLLEKGNNTEFQKEKAKEDSVNVTPMDVDTAVPSPTGENTVPSTSNSTTSDAKSALVSAPLSDSHATQQQQSLAINQLQLAHAAAAAALSGTNDFPFLANFENTMDAIATSNTPTSGTNTPTSLHALVPNPSSQPPSQSQPEVQQQPLKQSPQQQAATDLSQLPTELLKRELINQKVRADNRERKKRWRQQNEERNKDNDLRCRVNKRAHKLFGKEDSEHKKKWIEEEFLKRQQKRKDKERRKGLVDDSLGGHAEGGLNTNNGLDLAALAQHLAPQQSLANMADASYLTLLCNNLGIPAAAARNFLGNMTAGHTDAQNSESQQQENVDDTSHPPTTTTTAESTPAPVDQTKEEKDPKASLQPFPFQILEILQQLQQYQPPQGSDQAGESSSSDFQITSSYGHGLGNMGERPEEKLVALLATTIQQAATVAAAAQAKESFLDSEANGSRSEMVQLPSHDNSKETDNPPEGTTENTNDDTVQNNNNAEFPMDAVLTLMQLNAGWRQ
ncbi:hypothetical protein BD560DRAFT_485935 [Blakeslea trispora]|nr:hypothetical protein BD560DRAFT_485935 [Blakeslea trispora]